MSIVKVVVIVVVVGIVVVPSNNLMIQLFCLMTGQVRRRKREDLVFELLLPFSLCVRCKAS